MADKDSKTENNALAGVKPMPKGFFDGYSVEQVVSLNDGEGFEAIYNGAGPDVEMTDHITGEVKVIKTWRFTNPDKPEVSFRILGSARLNAEFRDMPISTRVRVGRMGTKRTRGNRNVTDYVVARLK